MRKKVMLFLSVLFLSLTLPMTECVRAEEVCDVFMEEERLTTEQKVARKVEEIAAACRASGAGTQYAQAVWLHDWLTHHANYDYTFTEYGPEGVLLKGTGVCQSYTEAYRLLLNAFGIENIIVEAPEMNHAWNIVKLDGKYCHIDCTWDDPDTGGYEGYTYFGMSDELMSKDHTWNRSKYPACTSIDNYYPVRKGYTVVRDTTELNDYLNRASAAKETKVEVYYIGTDLHFDLGAEYEKWFYEYAGKYGIQSIQSSILGPKLEVTVVYVGACTEQHTFGAYTETKKPTVLANGTKTRQCSRCGKTETISVPKLTPAMTVNVSRVVLKEGQKFKTLKVTGLAAGDKVESYQTSSKKIFTVSETGVIKAKKKAGTAKLTITLKSGYSQTIEVEVQEKEIKTTKISGVKKNLTLKRGEKYTLTPVIKPANSTEKVTFSTADKKIATVSSKGVIKAKKKGTVKITVKSGNKKVSCKVKVK